MAFQIVDDVLDLREGSQGLGKPAGQDLRQGTVTLPTMLYAARLAPESPEAERLRGVVAGDLDGEEIDRLIDDIRASGVLDDAIAAAGSFADRARARLDVVPDPETRDLLHEIVEMVVVRSA
jgi:geranylgeranyl pyrophosphate synthase